MRYYSALLLTVILLLVSGCISEAPPEDSSSDVLPYVDPFIGTGFHGHTFPGAVVPHGRIQLSPDTHIMGWDASSGYHYEDTTLYGFSHTHLSGTGIGDMGDVLFLPFTGSVSDGKPVGRLNHDKEKASPGYYSLVVEPWNVQAELTATLRTGWHRYTFPEGEEARLMIDLSHVLQPNWGHRLVESELEVLDEYTVEGYRLTSGWAEYDPIWFRCTFNRPIVESDVVLNEWDGDGKSITAYFSFGAGDTPLEAKVSVSSVDGQGAVSNLEEASRFESFEAVVDAAKTIWQEELSVITIESDDESVLKNFYTALYHTKIAPMVFDDADGRYRGMDLKIHTLESGHTYTVYSLWDVFRSWYPLMTIIEPERSRAWAYDLYRHSEQGGLLPKWALNANYTGTMVGYPAVAILADAFAKGFIDSIPEKIIGASVKSSSWQPDFYEEHQGTRAEMVMPRHIYYKEKMGFVPIDSMTESVSYGLEMAYYDWCIARMAALAGNEALAEKYYEKGQAYRHYFDEEIKFMRGKKSDGSWDENFNPRFSDHMKSEFVEGNAWQWTPLVLHDLPGFAQLMGGSEGLGIWLDTLFNTTSVIEGENASGDITGLIGQYAHGNEPSHHVPFIYQYSDRPWRTQEVVDQILYDFYAPTPEGIIGNEDCGQMSAWYVLNAMGIYQITPGDTMLFIGRPIVDQARIKIGDGWFTIVVHDNSRANKYVQRAVLNGEELDGLRFDFRDIRSGGELEIFMQSKR